MQLPPEPEIKNTQQLNLFEEKLLSMQNRSRYRIIGQVFDTYWLIQFEDKLFIIDQHAAHEKVKYERLMKQFYEKSVVSQRLMPAIIVSLTGQEESILHTYEDAFAQLGFEIDAFGGNEYALRSVPVDLYGCSERNCSWQCWMNCPRRPAIAEVFRSLRKRLHPCPARRRSKAITV